MERACVRKPDDGAKQLFLHEGRWHHQHCSRGSCCPVGQHRIIEAVAIALHDEASGLVEPASKVEGIPVPQVPEGVAEADHAILDKLQVARWHHSEQKLSLWQFSAYRSGRANQEA